MICIVAAMTTRQLSDLDHLLACVETALRTVAGHTVVGERPNPADKVAEPDLSAAERRHAARLMRVDHVGEVCAQALYQSQAMMAREPRNRDAMQQAAREENDHLAWCNARLIELQDHVSYLNPFWYLGSFSIGAVAGLLGDKWNLGFVAETERQVVRHLENHLTRLPATDVKSRVILEQMKTDEARHATVAIETGAAELPKPIKVLMQLTSRFMTRIAYWI